MTSRTIEITILSTENLNMNKKPINKNTFVSLQSDSLCNEICYSTRVNSEEVGRWPLWNEKLVMEVPLETRFIIAEVKCKASRGGIKSVGVARIPVSDFFYVHQNQVQFLSYRLWDSNVKRNAVINISVRVKTPEYSLPVTGVPVAGAGSTGVVTGIPVRLSNL